ncbi:hypothetical protein [Cohaesibacter haloalkalitolerans]|uniref:hypothetical protein n=1 Tax=Cohaesibacter haloalkalitolerans TaxID=1162980 RepID=UPI001968B036|nr:hypothetical protein [Cohaesibacter haloalkalitolerans]
MILRPSVIVLGLVALFMVLLGVTVILAALDDSPRQPARSLVQQLGLSDLTLFTEARYTRNPSMADLSTAFQDHPVSLDHFPTGSLIGPNLHFSSKARIEVSDEEEGR